QPAMADRRLPEVPNPRPTGRRLRLSETDAGDQGEGLRPKRGAHLEPQGHRLVPRGHGCGTNPGRLRTPQWGGASCFHVADLRPPLKRHAGPGVISPSAIKAVVRRSGSGLISLRGTPP